MTYTIAEIAKILNGSVEGDHSEVVSHASKIDEATSGAISFISNPKYTDSLYSTQATAVLVHNDLVLKSKLPVTLVRVKDVSIAMQRMLDLFSSSKDPKHTISSLSSVDTTCVIAQNVHIGEFSKVSDGCSIGAGSYIYPQVYIGKDVTIGEDCKLYAGVRIEDNCIIGNRVIIHPNAVIGSDGFGFVPNEDRIYKKVIQAGNVVIEDDVEIGSNTVIDRATLGSTIIRQGVKLDNLIQIAHNVEIKKHTVIAAQSGVAGSTVIGAHSQIGGQVGVVGHIKLADGIKIQAQSGIASSIEESNSKWYGSPAMPYMNYLRSFAIFRKLPQLKQEISVLKKEIQKLLKSQEGQDI